ncbi:Bug family tripartite tricarboxylate transporter substrate binding protein [Ottowia caeni]|uniref:Bug family tripartite tricarboxylate transporter substrate binding protein n=1 Tax=Ottowia caeni TaxID=2870339 RepID=UPI003D762469
MFAEEMTKRLNQPVIVDNRPGASGQIAATSVARSAPDGYTILLGASPELAISKSLGRQLDYDIQKDLQPITLASLISFAVVVNPDVQAKSLKDFIELAKAKPASMNFASFGLGSSNHLFGEYFNNTLGVNIQHVPFKGSSAALPELVGGRVQLMFENVGVVLPLAQSGKLKVLAVTSPERSPLAPDVPTVAELGFPKLNGGTWTGFVAPKGTPPKVIEKLNEVIRSAAKAETVQSQLAKKGITSTTNSPDEFGKFMLEEMNRWKDVAAKANVKLDN